MFNSDMFSATPFWQNGPAPGKVYNFPGTQASTGLNVDYSQRTQAPTTTATSVIGIRFDQGVIIAADTLGSYGSMARFYDCPRVLKINDKVILGAGGDYADFQYFKALIESKILGETCLDDGIVMQPRSLYTWITRILYNKRSNMDPLWNNFIVGGIQNDGTPFLGTVDKLGTAYEDKFIATGFGAHLATPLFREFGDSKKAELTEADARDLVHRCMEVLYYRDARSCPKFQLSVCTKDGIKMEENLTVKQNWDLAHMIVHY